MTTDTTIETTPRQRIEEACALLGLTMTAEFVPFSRSLSTARVLNWRVTLIADRRELLTADYAQDCPAVSASVEELGASTSFMRHHAVTHEIETGRVYTKGGKGARIEPHELPEVIASLVIDTEVLDAATFEEWASKYEFDPDSRRAEATYRTRLQNSLLLRNRLGDANLARLKKACGDY